jgi:hypothetical protein
MGAALQSVRPFAGYLFWELLIVPISVAFTPSEHAAIQLLPDTRGTSSEPNQQQTQGTSECYGEGEHWQAYQTALSRATAYSGSSAAKVQRAQDEYNYGRTPNAAW